jgi:hypothetical protein
MQEQKFRCCAATTTGGFSDAKVIRKFGDVPDDVSTL